MHTGGTEKRGDVYWGEEKGASRRTVDRDISSEDEICSATAGLGSWFHSFTDDQGEGMKTDKLIRACENWTVHVRWWHGHTEFLGLVSRHNKRDEENTNPSFSSEHLKKWS